MHLKLAALACAPAPNQHPPEDGGDTRDKVGDLISQLQQTDHMLEAKDALRGLVDITVGIEPTTPSTCLNAWGIALALFSYQGDPFHKP
ncbi:hypothetical protein EDD53_2316 [Pacificibacter maritimus]|uniref:Uncharacterized protein n=1 Tax=Pacificibacter maritimus TaxID=762213 RepID=A0A3N4UH72_9RHOB|nr:hypothetical protein [Pacificibacter maritimus]RPE66611.1 hypothetical protein EDD53_2316 [Pacificibacter maritimus]